MTRAGFSLLLLCLIPGHLVWAAPDFPRLSGRVVDQANMLSNRTEQELTTLSAAHEQATSNQVVVVTLPDLQGYSIEEFGYQLGRNWGIGQRDSDNGVLLIIAKAERKVRIEVGYGLEGALTDAIASDIIHRVITPRFKRAQFDSGALTGTQSIIAALGGEYQRPSGGDGQQGSSGWWKFFMFVLFVFVLPAVTGRRSIFWWFLGSSMASSRGRHSSGGFGGGGFGGGFGGGGGGFGGGSSGSW